jgi:hypothetical protein
MARHEGPTGPSGGAVTAAAERHAIPAGSAHSIGAGAFEVLLLIPICGINQYHTSTLPLEEFIVYTVSDNY